MKREWKDVTAALIFGALVPYLLLNAAAMLHRQEIPPTREPAPLETTAPDKNMDYRIQVQTEDGIKTMELESYLVGVVLGEVPASFEIEALKAQAVVARTYTLRCFYVGSKHNDADICTDPACCQAYWDPEAYDGSVESLKKIQGAVEATRGLVLTYEDELIEATYFSSSGGRTEDAVAVWGNDVPYLQATDSPEYGYEDQYLKTVTFTGEQFQEALGQVLTGSCRDWFGAVTLTNGGGVDTMVIGGRKYTGPELRKLLGLRSTAFSLSVSGNTITITTRGYGHRVGMSQYGAEAMAVEGYTFQQILAHYYQGTVLEEYIDNGPDMG